MSSDSINERTNSRSSIRLLLEPIEPALGFHLVCFAPVSLLQHSRNHEHAVYLSTLQVGEPLGQCRCTQLSVIYRVMMYCSKNNCARSNQTQTSIVTDPVGNLGSWGIASDLYRTWASIRVFWYQCSMHRFTTTERGVRAELSFENILTTLLAACVPPRCWPPGSQAACPSTASSCAGTKNCRGLSISPERSSLKIYWVLHDCGRYDHMNSSVDEGILLAAELYFEIEPSSNGNWQAFCRECSVHGLTAFTSK